VRSAQWLILLSGSLLLPAAASAGDGTSSIKGAETRTIISQTVLALRAEPAYRFRWRRFRSSHSPLDADAWRRPIADIGFEDRSALARVRKLRGFSLLTFAETRGARLFLGVNERGLLGLHFAALPGNGDQRYLQMARMPYLRAIEPYNSSR
jgi:hypothetical protein